MLCGLEPPPRLAMAKLYWGRGGGNCQITQQLEVPKKKVPGLAQ